MPEAAESAHPCGPAGWDAFSGPVIIAAIVHGFNAGSSFTGACTIHNFSQITALVAEARRYDRSCRKDGSDGLGAEPAGLYPAGYK